MVNSCPACGKGTPGKDSLCDACAFEYNGTHYGMRGSDDDEADAREYKNWCYERQCEVNKERAAKSELKETRYTHDKTFAWAIYKCFDGTFMVQEFEKDEDGYVNTGYIEFVNDMEEVENFLTGARV